MSEEKCPKCNELKSACKCTKDDGKQKIEIKVDTGNIEAVLQRMTKIENENKLLLEEAKKAAEEKEKFAKTTEEQNKIKEDLDAQLAKINAEKLAERQKVLMAKVKEVISDPAKVKEYEEKIKDPNAISGIEYSIDTLATVVAQGQKQHEEILKKEKEDFDKKLAEKTGGVGNLPANLGGQGEGGNSGAKNGEEFEGVTMSEANANMVRELRKRSHSSDPEVAAKAKGQIEEMMRKWGVAVKRNYDSKAMGGLGEIGPKNIKEQPSLRKITKVGGEAI
jgi:hypothetical protein